MIDVLELQLGNWIIGPDSKPVQVNRLEVIDAVDSRKRPIKKWLVNGLLTTDFKELSLTIDLLEELGFPYEETEDEIIFLLEKDNMAKPDDNRSGITVTYLKKQNEKGYDAGDFQFCDGLWHVRAIDDLQRLFIMFTGHPLEIHL